MTNNTKYKIGMRNIKTTIAVATCLLILSPFENLTPVPACFAAIICMQDTVEKTISSSLSRFIGTIVGGLVALTLVSLNNNILHNRLLLNLLFLLGITITIYICNLVGHGPASVVACFSLCLVMLSYEDTARYSYAIIRMGETLLGGIIAVIINRLLPDNRKKQNSK